MAEQLSEYANFELGEAFFGIVNKMIVKDGIPFSQIGDFDFVSPSWRKLADKTDKSEADIKKLDEDYKMEIRDLADSCIVYMSAKLKKKDYTFNFEEYKQFIEIVDKNLIPNDSVALTEYNKRLEICFKKIANHGVGNGDNLIDHKDWAAYIYALDLKSEHNDKNEFSGFNLNGKITPMNYALMYNQLRENNDNMSDLKLRQAYKNLFG